MAVDPISNVVYINQNAQVGSTQYANVQTKLDFQAMVNLQAMDDKQDEIKEVRPTEETLKSNEDSQENGKQEASERGEHKEEKEVKEEDENSIELSEDGHIKHLNISV